VEGYLNDYLFPGNQLVLNVLSHKIILGQMRQYSLANGLLGLVGLG